MLANLNITINTNAAQAAQSMQGFGGEARTQMGNSAAAADAFAKRMDAANATVAQSAKGIGTNMAAANDEIIRKTEESAQAVGKVGEAMNSVDTESFAHRFGAAFGAAFGAGYAIAQTWLQKIEAFVVEKTKIIGIGLAIGLVSATAAAVYGAYRIISGTLGFIEGLFTGESYKSANIDALVAANKQVMELQQSLAISAVEAAALGDALSRLGVDKSTYVDTFTKAATAMRSNTEELDRLGVQYKNTNGQLLSQEKFLGNVKIKLDEYNDGFDRSAAAAAIGAGSYLAVSAALKVTDAQLDQSHDRLNDYLLSIGPETQAAVAKYQQAMRDFDNESRLTSEGFKRAVADNIMPALTNLAQFFQEGFPSAVRVFRYSFATVTSLFFGLQTVVYIVTESILGAVQSIGIAVGGLGTAMYRALSGDMGGARQALVQGWEDAKNRFADIGNNIVAQARNNRDAMSLAWALDDRGQSISGARNDAASANANKKSWVPKPKEESAQAAVAERQSPYQNFLNQLDQQITKYEQSEYASMRLKAAQLAEKEGITDLTAALDKINKLQRVESQRAVDMYVDKLKLESQQYAEQTSVLLLNAQQQEVAISALKRRSEAEQLIIQARKSGKPLDDQALADLKASTDAQVAAMKQLIESRQELERSWSYGSTKALQQYIDDAGNAAKQAQNLFANSFKNMEDALVKFVKTGKLDFKSLADGIISDLIRIQIQNSITKPLAQVVQGGGGFGGIFNGIKSFLGFADGGSPPVGVPSMVGENGPELFVPNNAGTILPASVTSSLLGGGGGGGNITINQPLVINANNASAETVGQVRALMPGFIAENKRVIESVIQQAMQRRGGRFAA